ncbi:hypothetical protein KCU83_g8687, partial [Aureobasidium melanogenum]
MTAIIHGLTSRQPNIFTKLEWDIPRLNMRDKLYALINPVPQLLQDFDRFQGSGPGIEDDADRRQNTDLGIALMQKALKICYALKEWEVEVLMLCYEKQSSTAGTGSPQSASFEERASLYDVCRLHGYGFFSTCTQYWTMCNIFYSSLRKFYSQLQTVMDVWTLGEVALTLPEWVSPELPALNVAQVAGHFFEPGMGLWAAHAAVFPCQPANSSKSWIQDEPGNDCYQQVPAAAYFSGESAFGWDEYYPTAVGPPLTIGPDYRPYILPPASMTDWANSIFSTSECEIQVDGVWDPPRALLPGTTVLTPVVAWGTATSTIAVSTSSASPAEVNHSQLAETPASQVISTATAVADSLGSEQTSRTESSGLTTVIITSEIRVGVIFIGWFRCRDFHDGIGERVAFGGPAHDQCVYHSQEHTIRVLHASRWYAGYAVGEYVWACHRAFKHTCFRTYKSEVISFELFTFENLACGIFTCDISRPGCRARDLR